MECLEFLRETLNHVLEIICGSRRGDRSRTLPDIPQLNDSVFQFHKPVDDGVPEIEVIFLHGIQQHGDSSRAHLTTWTSMSPDGSTSFYWPSEFLAKDFPSARVLSVSYDSSISRGPKSGLLDLDLIAENLKLDLIVIHRPGCPIVLVGQDVGGLVIKAICKQMDLEGERSAKTESFLRDIKCILFYNTPHFGFRRLPSRADGAFAKSLGPLDAETARLDQAFRDLRSNASGREWKTMQMPTESDFGLEEGNMRNDVKDYYMDLHHDLHSMSKPQVPTDPGYDNLRNLVQEALESSSHKSVLLFERDKKYVPMEKTMGLVWDSLEAPKVKGVILHGDAGTGKSSLARHFALRLETETAAKIGRGQKSSQGVVCYVNCGFEASIIDVQDQLLSYFNVAWRQHLEVTVKSEERLIRERHRILIEHLRNLHAILILDDVYESKLLKNVLVPGDNLKYLVMTRDANLWSKTGWQSIGIEPLNLPSALQILASHAQFKDCRIPEQFQTQAREIIEEVQYQPLAVATLGVVLQRKNKFRADVWNGLQNSLETYLDRDRAKVTNSGQSYPMSVSKALMLMLDSNFLNDDALNLLYILCLFQGPLISESVVKSFLMYFQPEALKDFDLNIEALEALSLVQSVRQHEKPVFVELQGRSGESRRIDRSLNGESRYHRHFVLHNLRQQFILQKKTNEMDALATSLGYGPHEDLPTLLIAFFGITKGSAIREEAKTRGGISNHTIGMLRSFLRYSLEILPVKDRGRRLHDEQDTRVVMTCIEVLHALLVNGTVDDEKIVILLEEQLPTEWICTVLIYFLQSPHPGRPASRHLLQGGSFVNKALDILAETEEMTVQFHILLFLSIAQKPDKLPSIEKLLRTLIRRDFLSENKGSLIRLQSAYVICEIVASPSNASIAVNIPGCVHSLIKFLREHVNYLDHQIAVLCALHCMVDQEGTTIFNDPATDTLTLLQRIMAIAIQDARDSASQNADEIREVVFLHASILAFALLGKIMTILSQDAGEICKNSFHLISTLADSSGFAEAAVKNTNSYLDKLVCLLMAGNISDDTQFEVVLILRNILNIVPQLAGNILETPGFLDKILGLLADNVPYDLQCSSLSLLTLLTQLDESRRKMLGTKALLDRMTTFLVEDFGERCEAAVHLIDKLAQEPCNSEVVIKCCSSRGCLPRLVQLLEDDEPEGTNKAALQALLRLTVVARTSNQHGEIYFKKLETTNILERLNGFLSGDMGPRCELSIAILANVASAPTFAEKIVKTPGCLENTFRLLADDVAENLQIRALRTLLHLVRVAIAKRSDFLVMKMLDTKALFYGVNRFLVKDFGERCKLSLQLIAELTQAPCASEIITESCSADDCLPKLVELLDDNVSEGIHLLALRALLSITTEARASDHQATIYFEKLEATDVLQRLNGFLLSGMGTRCELSLSLITNVAAARTFAEKIVETPGCVDVLLRFLADDVAESQQATALGALAILTSSAGQDGTLVKILESRGLLEAVMKFLSRDLGRRCQIALMLVTRLVSATCIAETVVKCCSAQDYLDKLVGLLATDVEEGIQFAALQALQAISAMACTSTQQWKEVHSKVLQTANALEKINNFLSSDKGRRCEMAASIIVEIGAELADQASTLRVQIIDCLKRLVNLLHDYDTRALAFKSIRLLQFHFHDEIEQQMRTQGLSPSTQASIYGVWAYENAKREDYEGALKDINKAVNLQSERCLYLQEQGVVRRLMGDLHGALEDLDKALEIHDDDYECLKQRAFVKYLKGDQQGACADAERATTVMPDRVRSNPWYGEERCLGSDSVEFLEYRLR